MYSRDPWPGLVKSTSHTSYGLKLPSSHGLTVRKRRVFSDSFRQTCWAWSPLHTVVSSNRASTKRLRSDRFVLA